MKQYKYDFYRRLVAMYGKYSADNLYRIKVGGITPTLLEVEKPKEMFDLNDL